MNGLSDTRLSLHAKELELDHLRVRARTSSAAEDGRWHRFWRRLQTRRALLNLDEQALRDIGLTREQAREEALKPFWKL